MWQKIKSWREKMATQLLWRLTITNIIIIALFILLSGVAVYQTACFLVGRITDVGMARQLSFNSTLFQYLWIFSLIAIVSGSVVHYFMMKQMMQPITELTESMKRLKQGSYPAVLETKNKDEIGQLVEHFNEMNLLLRENEQKRNKMLTDMAHELRTPLANINGYLEGLSKGVIEGSPELYHSLHQEAKRITAMMQQLHEVKEWDSLGGQSYPEREMVEISDLAANCVQLFQWELDNQKVKVVTEVEESRLFVHREGIQQVLTNLFQNAIQYYEGEEPITITGKQTETAYQLSVAGPGSYISETEKTKIFERFYRIDPSRSRETGGSGLGLAISKEIIEQHNGSVQLDTDGYHHTFTFTLPLP
ncbi:HAMP domain-containing sensor histidine kinase [Thalassobacillus devorans]|uniref:HAMP domain-containing sensor histidine kinase n=1 Tax=Thalassobacillus devorans TaxID=279813 RepID=UPI000A1CE43A|nr:ATP-binding protein [Thalassobacillus devorans]